MATYGPSIYEWTLAVPQGYECGSLVARPGGNWRHVIRKRDGASVLCRQTPVEDEVLPMREMADALSAACDEAAKAAKSHRKNGTFRKGHSVRQLGDSPMRPLMLKAQNDSRERWERAAEAQGKTLSAWIRGVLDAAA
jgi:hypothetical protein